MYKNKFYLLLCTQKKKGFSTLLFKIKVYQGFEDKDKILVVEHTIFFKINLKALPPAQFPFCNSYMSYSLVTAIYSLFLQ